MRVSSEGLPWGSQVARIRLSLWVLEPLLVVMEPPPSCWTVGSMKAAFLPSPDAQWSWLTELYESVECREREREAGGPTRIKGTWKLLGTFARRNSFPFQAWCDAGDGTPGNRLIANVQHLV